MNIYSRYLTYVDQLGPQKSVTSWTLPSTDIFPTLEVLYDSETGKAQHTHSYFSVQVCGGERGLNFSLKLCPKKYTSLSSFLTDDFDFFLPHFGAWSSKSAEWVNGSGPDLLDQISAHESRICCQETRFPFSICCLSDIDFMFELDLVFFHRLRLMTTEYFPAPFLCLKLLIRQ